MVTAIEVPPLTSPLDVERVVADIAARFVSIGPTEVDAAIVDSQRQLVEILGVDRSALLQVTADADLQVSHAWTRPELATPMPALPLRASFPWIMARLEAGEVVVFDDAQDARALPSERDRASLRTISMASTLAVPLTVDRQFIGVQACSSLRIGRPVRRDLIDPVQLIGHVFARALQRRRSQETLAASLAEVSRLRDLLARDNEVLRREVSTLRPASLIPANSAATRSVLQVVDQVAPTNATVLLLGETGSGKEVFAKEIHQRSPRHAKPMVSVNCGAIPTALLESELFGRERGAFTGAISRQIGRFELAAGSTIFLDEIGELPLESQVKLLRVLEDRVVERLGSTQPHKVDVRVIAATNRSLEDAVAARTFREDLYYRLNVFPIMVPPLRERIEDIPSLVWHFIDEFSRAFGKPITTVSSDSMAALQRYGWPGNVRELRNAVEHAMILATDPRLEVATPHARTADAPRSFRLEDVEAAHILHVLTHTGWRVRGPQGAADLLGLKPTTLEGRMTRLGLRRPPTATIRPRSA